MSYTSIATPSVPNWTQKGSTSNNETHVEYRLNLSNVCCRSCWVFSAGCLLDKLFKAISCCYDGLRLIRMFTWERIMPKLDHLSNQTQLLLTFVETKTICLVLINISTRIGSRNLSKSNELVSESGFWEICSYPKEWC